MYCGDERRHNTLSTTELLWLRSDTLRNGTLTSTVHYRREVIGPLVTHLNSSNGPRSKQTEYGEYI